MNLLLIGQRACGKTAAARTLSQRLRIPWYDTDTAVEEETGTRIARLFEEKGEAGFRELEKVAVDRIKELRNTLISTGGGTLLDKSNRAILCAAGKVVWLDASPKTLLARRLPGDRPALTGLPLKEEIAALDRERRPIYAAAAGIRLDTDPLTLDQVVEALERIWLEAQR